MHVKAELKNSPDYGNHTIDTTFELDLHESLDIYDNGLVKLSAELLAEKEGMAKIGYIGYAKNAAGEYEKRISQVLFVNYMDALRAAISSKKLDFFVFTLRAQKV